MIEESLLFSGTFVSDLLARLRGEVVHVVLVHRRGEKGLRQNLLANWRSLGVCPLSRLARRVVVRKAIARLPPGLNGLAGASAEQIARAYGIPSMSVERLCTERTSRRIKALCPDVLITSVSEILDADFLAIPRVACLNKHASLLPSYAGLLPVFQAVAHGETRVGMTVHVMTVEIDAGEVLSQRAITVEQGDTIWSLYQELYAGLGAQIEHAIAVLKGESEPIVEQPVPAPSYYSYPTAEDWAAFRNCGIPFA